MARTCRLARAGRSVAAEWRRDGDALLLSPQGEPALSIPLAEVLGIAGDGFTIRLSLPDGEIALERLGGDGPTLLEALRREWPVLRAAVLRLADGERPAELFAGHVSSPGLRGPFRGFYSEARLIVAPEGGDVSALFVADVADAAFDQEAYALRLAGWDGAQTVFTRLGARSTAFAGALLGARETLARQAGEVVARFLPNLAAGSRAALAARWLPGRLLSFAEIERIAPGFEASFISSWLASTPRAEAGRGFMDGVEAGDRHLAYAAPPEGAAPFLWLLARRGETSILELLSHGDYATYLFHSGDDLPGLIQGLVRLPDFSREALYLPLEQLTGERGEYAIPARDLPLLRNLRARFAERKIHSC